MTTELTSAPGPAATPFADLAAPRRSTETTPGFRRRLACLLYEGVLLFGVVMLTGLVYSPLAQQRHALQGTAGLQLALFVVLGVYFVVFWTRGGQTVAMKTWRIRVVTHDAQPLSARRAVARYLAAWLWFVPALATIKLAGLRGGWVVAAVVLCGAGVYAALALLRRDKQYWHDVVCGTRLIDWPAPLAREAS